MSAVGDARKRATEAASNSESAALATNSPNRGDDTSGTANGPQNGIQPIPAPVDSGTIGRLNDAETDRVLEAVWSWEEADEGVMAEEVVLPVVDEIVREHTDRALAEVEQRINAIPYSTSASFNTGRNTALAIVRAARQEQGLG